MIYITRCDWSCVRRPRESVVTRDLEKFLRKSLGIAIVLRLDEVLDRMTIS